MCRWRRIAPVLFALALSYLLGCSKNPTRLIIDRGAPETELTYAPVEADTASFRVHLYWNGYDSDGEVVRFRFAIDSDTLKPALKWHVTYGHDSVFTFHVAPGDLVGGHVFWVSAEDNDGKIDHTPAKRYFSIRTLPPTSQITGGPAPGAVAGPTTTFSWSGNDPDGSETGGPVPVDSFEYMLLRPGTSFDGNHTPLPVSLSPTMLALLNEASSNSLPAPYDDWKWTATSARSHTFTGLDPASYVFAVRAVDAAGAHSVLQAPRNVRGFWVTPSPERQSAPWMRITSEALTLPITSDQSPIDGPSIRQRFSILDGEPVSLSWVGLPSLAGYPLAGFTSALDDTTVESWSHPNLASTGITLPEDITPGTHHLYVRLLDVSGASNIADLVIDVVHAAFREPGQPASMLYVDDFASPPGTWDAAELGGPNFPTDAAEDGWWSRTILAPLAQEHGMTFEQSDPVYRSVFSPDGNREPPTLGELAQHRVVIWSVDFNNTISSPTGLWRTLVGGGWSELRTYVRGGGTLILTGFTLGRTASRISSLPSQYFGVMCARIAPGTFNWDSEYFLRDYMGIDGARSSDEGGRREGARDFVGAQVTQEGSALGFQTAEVDTGAASTGAKWNPYAFFFGNADATLSPGLPRVEGWMLEKELGCHADESLYRRENPALPIAVPLFTYHGVNEGVLQDGPPSPREDLVVGIATQAHDDGNGNGSVVTPGNAHGVTGRMVFLGFPIYYMKDAQAYQVMRTAFAYVNASPTLAPAP